MNADTWALVKEIFEAAGELSTAERPLFLDRACGADADVRAQVESLLAARDDATDFMETPAIATALALDESRAAADPLLGRQVEQYRVREVLGQGGMGTVYLAEQENPRRTVALKLIRESAVSPTVLRRFEHEVHVLGRLQHAGIAQIFEAGTADLGHGPRPFFAMEYIRGQPVTRYAEEASLGTRQRLALVARICDAVQHAHQNGVIHRDLKPANILVVVPDDGSRTPVTRGEATRGATTAGRSRSGDAWAVGQPKILDFGVARAMDSDLQHTTMRTDVGQLVGTLAYMSPEQVRGNPADLDARSDIYSLGVITYELLTGRLPHEVRNRPVAEAARVLTEHDPTPLSSLNRVFRGDIETIVAKAMEKDKTRRYQSASEFAADIERYLVDRPIVARPPSAFYQLRKFTKRNKVLVGGVLGVFAALSAAVVGTSLGMVRAWEAEKRSALDAVRARDAETVARNEAQRAHQAEETARSEAQRARREADTASAVRDFLIRVFRVSEPSEARGERITAREILDRAAGEIRGSLEYDPEVRATLLDTLGHVYYLIGLNNTAAPLIDEALEIRTRLHGEHDPSVAESLNHKSLLLRELGRLDDAESVLRSALDAQRAAQGDETPAVTEMMTNYGVLQIKRGDARLAKETLQQVVEARQELYGPDHPLVSVALSNLAWAHKVIGENAESEEKYLRALKIQRDRLGDVHPQTAETLHNLGALYAAMGRLDDAERFHIQARDAFVKLHGEKHPDVEHTLNSLASVYARRGEFDRAETMYHEALAMVHEIFGKDHPDAALVNNNLGKTLSDARRLDEAEPYLREAIRVYRMNYPDGHPLLADAMNNLAGILMLRKRFDEAEALYRDSLEICRAKDLPSRASLARGLGAVLSEKRDHAAAEALYREALEADRARLDPKDTSIAANLHNLALQLRLQGKLAEAEAPLREALEIVEATLGSDHADTLVCVDNFAALMLKLERFDEAVAAFRRVLAAREQRLSPLDPLVVRSRARLAIALLDAGRADEAETHARTALDAREKALPPESEDLAEARVALGACLGALRRFDEGEPLILAGLERYRALRGDKHPNTLGAMRRAAKFYETRGDVEKAAEYRAMSVKAAETQGMPVKAASSRPAEPPRNSQPK